MGDYDGIEVLSQLPSLTCLQGWAAWGSDEERLPPGLAAAVCVPWAQFHMRNDEFWDRA